MVADTPALGYIVQTVAEDFASLLTSTAWSASRKAAGDKALAYLQNRLGPDALLGKGFHGVVVPWMPSLAARGPGYLFGVTEKTRGVHGLYWACCDRKPVPGGL